MCLGSIYPFADNRHPLSSRLICRVRGQNDKRTWSLMAAMLFGVGGFMNWYVKYGCTLDFSVAGKD